MYRETPRIVFDGRTVIHEDLTLTDEDRRFAEQLTRQQIVEIDELKQGVRIVAKWSWVGVVRFSNFELQIKPKLSALDIEADNLALAEMLDFISDTHEIRAINRFHDFDAAGTNLFELIVASFADACEEVVSRGVLADYVQVEEQLPVLRGSLLVMRQLQERSGRFDLLHCVHDEQSTDICENKLLLSALTVCKGMVIDQWLKAQVMRLTAIFNEVASVHAPDFDFDDEYKVLRQGGYNRLNSYYRRSHELAALLMQGMGFNNVFASGEQKCFSFLFKMSEVFEKFVSKLLTMHLRDESYAVHAQKEESRILWNAVTNRSYASLRPDLLIENKARPDVFLPVDAKYKNYDGGLDYADDILHEGGIDAFDELAKKVSTQDIFQTFTYAQGFANAQNSASPTSIILYASSSSDAAIRRIHVRRRVSDDPRGTIVIVPVNVKKELAAVKDGQQTRVMLEAVEIIAGVLNKVETIDRDL